MNTLTLRKDPTAAQEELPLTTAQRLCRQLLTQTPCLPPNDPLRQAIEDLQQALEACPSQQQRLRLLELQWQDVTATLHQQLQHNRQLQQELLLLENALRTLALTGSGAAATLAHDTLTMLESLRAAAGS